MLKNQARLSLQDLPWRLQCPARKDMVKPGAKLSKPLEAALGALCDLLQGCSRFRNRPEGKHSVDQQSEHIQAEQERRD